MIKLEFTKGKHFPEHTIV